MNMSYFVLYLHNLHNRSVLGSRLKTSLFLNISFGRKTHPSVQGIAICTGPEKNFVWLVNIIYLHLHLLKI